MSIMLIRKMISLISIFKNLFLINFRNTDPLLQSATLIKMVSMISSAEVHQHTVHRCSFSSQMAHLSRKPFCQIISAAKKTWDDTGILLFDADMDGDPDLYIASGGYENERNSPSYQDHFYVNDGKGNFTEHA